MPTPADRASRPRLVASKHQPLGNILQRLAQIAPDDLRALTMLARDVLKHAERRHQRYFPHGPYRYDKDVGRQR